MLQRVYCQLIFRMQSTARASVACAPVPPSENVVLLATQPLYPGSSSTVVPSRAVTVLPAGPSDPKAVPTNVPSWMSMAPRRFPSSAAVGPPSFPRPFLTSRAPCG